MRGSAGAVGLIIAADRRSSELNVKVAELGTAFQLTNFHPRRTRRPTA